MPAADADPIARRRRQLAARSRRRLTVVLIGGGGLALLVACAAAGVLLSGRSRGRGDEPGRSGVFGPTAGNEGAAWNHHDLHTHLRKRGLDLDMVATRGKNPFGPAAAYLYGPATGKHTGGDGGYVKTCLQFGADDVCRVELHDTPTSARDEAGLYGESGWYWGRFSFQVAPKGRPLLARIRSALR